MKQVRYLLTVLVCLSLLAGWNALTVSHASSSRAYAQQTEGGRGGGQFTQFREAHKYTFQLMGMAGNIGRLDKETKTPLTKAQAKAVLAVLKPLRAKPKLTQDEAKKALKGLKKVLTEKQLTEIGKMKPEDRRGGQRMGSGNGDRPRGEGNGGGQRRRFDPDAMKNFNPFNPSKDAPGGERSAKRWQEFFAALEKKAK